MLRGRRAPPARDRPGSVCRSREPGPCRRSPDAVWSGASPSRRSRRSGDDDCFVDPAADRCRAVAQTPGHRGRARGVGGAAFALPQPLQAWSGKLQQQADAPWRFSSTPTPPASPRHPAPPHPRGFWCGNVFRGRCSRTTPAAPWPLATAEAELTLQQTSAAARVPPADHRLPLPEPGSAEAFVRRS